MFLCQQTPFHNRYKPNAAPFKLMDDQSLLEIAISYVKLEILRDTSMLNEGRFDGASYVLYHGENYERDKNGFLVSWKKFLPSWDAPNIHVLFWNPSEYQALEQRVKDWMRDNTSSDHRVIPREKEGGI